MQLIDWIGGAAGLLTSLSYLPQLHKIWLTKSAGDISTAMFVGLYVGVALWFFYAIELNAIHMIVANGASLLIMSGILVLKYTYRGKPSAR